jgi:large repetitive protein
MKRASLAFLVAVLFAAGCSSTATKSNENANRGTARKRATHLTITRAGFQLPAPVQREVAAVDATSILLAGGLSASGSSTNGVFTLDPKTGHVSQLGTVPQVFHDAAGALIGNRLEIFGGGSASSTNMVQAFDLGSQHGTVIGHLPTPLSDVSSATIGSTTYLVGGYDGHAAQSAIYDTTNGSSFRSVGTLPRGLRYTAVTAVDGRVVVAGGTIGTAPVNTVSVFDPNTGRVTLLAHLPAPVAHAAAFTLGGGVYVAGGQDAAGNAVRTVTRIDPATGSVARLKPLAQPVSDAAVAELSSQAWLIGGWRGTTVRQVLVARLAHHPA